ncbi:MAG: DegV family protein [bacterium]
MNFKIITDSCCDLPRKIMSKIETIPMSLMIDGKSYKDGVNLSKEKFYELLKKAKDFPGSAAPSPYDYMSKYKLENNHNESIFVFTVSSSLSSSYDNAIMAKNQLLGQISKKADSAIHVFDSFNASIGQGLAILKLKELLDKNLPHQQIVETIEKYISETNTFFVLEKMDNLINSGRINKILGRVVSALNIKLIMGKNEQGEIELYDKVRGSKRAFKKLLKTIDNHGSNIEKKTLGISHYNCIEKARKFKEKAKELYPFKDIIITQMGPTIATYADEGALLISF